MQLLNIGEMSIPEFTCYLHLELYLDVVHDSENVSPEVGEYVGAGL